MGAGDIAVIGDNAMVTGFRMGGVPNHFELEGEKAEAKLEELIASGNFSVVIVNERILFNASRRLRKKIELTARPIIVPVPSKEGPVEEKEAASLREMVKRALGFDLVKGGGASSGNTN